MNEQQISEQNRTLMKLVDLCIKSLPEDFIGTEVNNRLWEAFELGKQWQGRNLTIQRETMKWISVKDRLPEEFVTCFLRWTYTNANTGMAAGYLDDGEWEIEWSDYYPQSKDISHWIAQNPT